MSARGLSHQDTELDETKAEDCYIDSQVQAHEIASQAEFFC